MPDDEEQIAAETKYTIPGLAPLKAILLLFYSGAGRAIFTSMLTNEHASRHLYVDERTYIHLFATGRFGGLKKLNCDKV